MKFLSIGDIMMDVSVVIKSEIEFAGDTRAKVTSQGGGAAANVAVWLAEANQDVFLNTRVGDDQPGEYLLRELANRGVKNSQRQIKGESTGVVVVLVDKNGERSMFPDSGANSGLSLKDLPDLNQFEVTYFSGYALINPQSRRNALEILESLKMPIVIDPGTVGALNNIPLIEIKNWLSHAAVLILNGEEAKYISNKNKILDALKDLKKIVPTVVIKLGDKGAIAIDKEIVEVGIGRKKPIDTTGAGDAFVAGFISQWFKSYDLRDAINQGSILASKCISFVGAWPAK
ncbi:MAG: carbohydrate kinase family protein [Actinobacteria bacterium]|nr:carbohydrate kinase family protein [Actinomycetota bacterium]